MNKKDNQALEVLAQAIRDGVKEELKHAPFDRTTEGTVLEALGGSRYKVAAFGSVYTVSTGPSLSLHAKDKVRLTVPQNNWSLMYVADDGEGAGGGGGGGGIVEVNGYDTAVVTLVTDDVGEGEKNLYWTPARGTASFAENWGRKTADDLPEGGGHQYYTEGRAKAAAGTVFDEKFAQKTTDALAEGAQHQYYTAGRATENFKANIAGTSVLTLKDVDQLVTKQKSYIIDAGRLG